MPSPEPSPSFVPAVRAQILGTLTGVRVANASHDDSALVLGMNRVRAAYVALDPGVADLPGDVPPTAVWPASCAPTRWGCLASTLSHVLGSTTMFVNVVNALIAGTLGALVADAAGAGAAVVAVIGVVCGLAYLGAWLECTAAGPSGSMPDPVLTSDVGLCVPAG